MSWLDNYSTTNTFRSMYINGFMDISGGRLQTRSVTDGHLLIAGDSSLNNLEAHGDVSLNSNLYVGGDISWNPNSLADNSIPSSAIIGGAVGATGPAGPVGSNTEVMLFDAVPTSSYLGVTNFQYKIYGSTDMLADHSCIRSQGTSSYAYNNNHNVRAIALLFKPGVYRFTLSARYGTMDEHTFGFDINHNNYIGYMNGDEDAFTPTAGSSSAVRSTTVRTFVITNNTNFYFIEKTNVTVSGYVAQAAQMMFEKIGNVESSGNDDTLAGYLGVNVINTEVIQGGLYWGSTVTKPTDPDEYLDLNESGTEWIYRIDPNTTSSVEVASFHSDADLSLNKRLFVGEFINTTNFYNVNSLLMPYYLVEWTNPSVGDLDTSYHDFRELFKAGKLHTNIHSNQLSIEAGSGGLSDPSPDPDNYVAFKVYPGVWELNFELNETGVGSNANANYVQFFLYHDNGSGTTMIHNSHGTHFTSGDTGYLKDFRYFTVPNGKSGWLRIFNSYSQSNRRMVVRNTGKTLNSATNIIPTVHLKCIQLNNWDGTDSTLTGVDSMNSTSIVSDWNSQNAIDYNTASNVFVNQI